MVVFGKRRCLHLCLWVDKARCAERIHVIVNKLNQINHNPHHLHIIEDRSHPCIMYNVSSCTEIIHHLKDAIKKCDISEISFLKSRVGIEAESVILRSIMPHAAEYMFGKNLTPIFQQLYDDIDNLVDYFKKLNVELIFVFSGLKLPGLKRSYRKKSDLLLENSYWAQLYRFEKEPTINIAHRAVKVNYELYKKLIDHCKRKQVNYLIAPYEAHAQLAYMSRSGYIDYVISDNINTLILGSTKIFLNLDTTNNICSLYELDKLYTCIHVSKDRFKFHKFRWAVLLSGCDYLESIAGSITFEMAYEFIFNPKYDKYDDCSNILRYMAYNFDDKKYLGLITKDYIIHFRMADEAMKFHLVYNLRTGCLRPIELYPAGNSSIDYPHAGKRIHSKDLEKIMTGDVNLDECHWQAFDIESEEERESDFDDVDSSSPENL